MFLRSRKGGVAVVGALAVPVLLVLIGGALDITAVQSERERLLQVAEGAALAGARDMGVAANPTVALQRSQAWAEQEIANWRNAPAASVSTSLADLGDGVRGVRVEISADRPSIFGRLLPPGGWHIAVNATAAPFGSTPLCMLAIDDNHPKLINVRDSAQIRAPACMVHSNNDVVVEGIAEIDAASVQAVRGIQGADGVTDAPPIADPFASLDLSPPTCGSTGVIEYSTGAHILPAGTHCHDIKVRGNAILRLAAGNHWFVDADLEVKEDARLEGDDVVLLFDEKSKFRFDDRALVRLTGRESGIHTGFVMIADRDNTHDFIITSENVESLLGVIYVPNARLIIECDAEVARESAWTVLVAEWIQLTGNPVLYMNADYNASDVPVPDGVGPSGGTRLVQ